MGNNGKDKTRKVKADSISFNIKLGKPKLGKLKPAASMIDADEYLDETGQRAPSRQYADMTPLDQIEANLANIGQSLRENAWEQAINEMAKDIHETAVSKGWWDEDPALTKLCENVRGRICSEIGGSMSHADIVSTEITTTIRDAWPKRNIGEMLMLVVTEIAEAYEEYRNGLWYDEYTGEDGKPEGAVVELADAIIRILDTAYSHGMPIGSAIRKKRAFNKTRPHRHGGKLA